MTIQKRKGRRPTPTQHLRENWHLRLKTARRVAGLSKLVLQEKYHLNAHTLASLEIARSTLSKEWGLRFCEALQNEKILCTPEWLFLGEGTPPKRLEDKDAKLLLERKTIVSSLNCPEETAIHEESKLFCSHHPDHIVTIVKDDAMSPYFEFGDYIGARKIPNDKVDSMLGEKCLVEIKPDEYVVRHFAKEDSVDNKYLLSSINPKSTVKRPLLFTNHIYSIGQIIWVRKFSRGLEN